MFDAAGKSCGDQSVIDDGVVQSLGIAVKHKRISLQQRIQQQRQVRIDQVNSIAWNNRLVVRNRIAKNRAHRIYKAIVEFEKVEVSY